MGEVLEEVLVLLKGLSICHPIWKDRRCNFFVGITLKSMTMAESPESTSIDQATPQELAEAIIELEQYRERLLNDTLTLAQRAKVKKAQAMTNLEPQLAQIDTMLETLRQRQTALTAGN